ALIPLLGFCETSNRLVRVTVQEKQTVNLNIKPNWFDQRKQTSVKTRKHTKSFIVYLKHAYIGVRKLPESLELDPPVMNLTNGPSSRSELRSPERKTELASVCS